MRQQVQQSKSATGTLRQLADPGQVQELGQQLKQTTSQALSSQSRLLDAALSQTGIGSKLQRGRTEASQFSQTLAQPVTRAKAVLQSGQATADAFKQLQRQPNARNRLDAQQKGLASAIAELPGGQQAVKSARKSFATPLKSLAEIPAAKTVLDTVKAGERAYKDIQACVKDPSLTNVTRASCSSVTAAATATVAVTAGLVALGVVSAPVSVPILAVGAAIGGIAAFVRSCLPKAPSQPAPAPAVPKPAPQPVRSDRVQNPPPQTGPPVRKQALASVDAGAGVGVGVGVARAQAAIQSGQETAQAFRQLQKQPNAANLQQLGDAVSRHERALEQAISELPAGKQAVKAAKKSLNVDLLKQVSDSPVAKAVIGTLKDGSRAYQDIQACSQDPSAKNLAKAASSSVKLASTVTVAATTGLVALGLVSAPVSLPIIAVGVAIGGVAALCRKWFS
ncbi:MAG: hypothetical protein CVV27_10070 [Candidatus Melainabacteria bacterium HGW-Melainabacteria-1]|nr:MAG: hypothetical protein CVV27_10070 [Candidatus Melainabacteria bacterium HGW-Melainabacteria-1]